MKDVLRELGRMDLTDYAPIPFWSWNNRLEKDKLIRQIGDMQSAGCGGFILHARTGLTTEYLSEEWFSLVEACLDEAKKRGMHAWIYDENGWPSGFVGGELLKEEENLACYLTEEDKDSYDPEAFAVFSGRGGSARRLSAGEQSPDGVYRNIYVRRSPANTDILNPSVVTKFLNATHEQYYRRFADRFGKELTGFFTDEPQYFRWGTPFTPVSREYWKQKFGEDIADGIIALFDDDEAAYPFRVRYYRMMNELYTENYYKRLYDWCDAHGCKLTGHSVEETLLFTQMWGCAGCTPSYEYEHIPGIDNLSKNGTARLSARQAGSLADQLGKKQVLTETFGCSGYAVSPKELKAIAEKQYVHGVNFLCHHLYAYSLAGQGKTDHPPCFSPHMTWWKEFPDFNRYFTRLGWLLANSEPCVNCVVINPMTSVYLRYDRFREDAAKETDIAFEKLQNELNAKGILYEIADERILARHGRADGNRLAVGRKEYKFVIVPDCRNLSASTKAILKQFSENGGKIYAAGKPEYTDGRRDDWDFLRSCVTADEIAAGGRIRLETDGKAEYTYRKGEGFEFLYLVNVQPETARVRIPAGFSRVDLLSLRTVGEGTSLTLKAGESALLMPVPGENPVVYGEAENITGQFRFAGAEENNLTLDTVRISRDGKEYGPEEPLCEAFDRLLREQYCGRLFLKYAFSVKGKGKRLILRREKGKYLSSSVNGVSVGFSESAFDFMFEEADISQFVRTGNNEYVQELDFYERPHVFWALYSPEATESVRNCLWYDTELENVYLLGDFSVDGERNILPPAPPAGPADLQKNGFPFFAGRVSFTARVPGRAGRARIFADGDYTAAEISVNGRPAGCCLFEHSAEIALSENEENEIEITLVSSLRNMFGPFHFSGDEENGVSPFSFTMRGAWKDGSCEYFLPEYKLVPFGARQIRIAYEK